MLLLAFMASLLRSAGSHDSARTDCLGIPKPPGRGFFFRPKPKPKTKPLASLHRPSSNGTATSTGNATTKFPRIPKPSGRGFFYRPKPKPKMKPLVSLHRPSSNGTAASTGNVTSQASPPAKASQTGAATSSKKPPKKHTNRFLNIDWSSNVKVPPKVSSNRQAPPIDPLASGYELGFSDDDDDPTQNRRSVLGQTAEARAMLQREAYMQRREDAKLKQRVKDGYKELVDTFRKEHAMQLVEEEKKRNMSARLNKSMEFFYDMERQFQEDPAFEYDRKPDPRLRTHVTTMLHGSGKRLEKAYDTAIQQHSVEDLADFARLEEGGSETLNPGTIGRVNWKKYHENTDDIGSSTEDMWNPKRLKRLESYNGDGLPEGFAGRLESAAGSGFAGRLDAPKDGIDQRLKRLKGPPGEQQQGVENEAPADDGDDDDSESDSDEGLPPPAPPAAGFKPIGGM